MNTVGSLAPAGATSSASSLGERARRRLMRELQRMRRSGVQAGIAATLPDEHNVMRWHATIHGPEDTPYAGAVLPLELRFANDYPRTPPDVRFTCAMFHPNVYENGRVCISILDRDWSPEMTAEKVLVSLRSLLAEPNPDSPANIDAGALLRNDRDAYMAKVIATLYDANCLE